MPVKVADTSVIAAIAFKESRAHEARALLGSSVIVAPTLLGYELANVARTKSLKAPHKAHDIELSLMDALNMDIHWHSVDHAATLRLALETGATTYDASYLYLSRSLAAPLITFDIKLLAILRA